MSEENQQKNLLTESDNAVYHHFQHPSSKVTQHEYHYKSQ